MSIDLNDLQATPDSEAWRPEIGDTTEGIVAFVGDPWVQWNDMSNSLNANVKIVFGGMAVYPRVRISDNRGDSFDDMNKAPDRLAKAIASAAAEAGLENLNGLIGGHLKVKRVEDATTQKGYTARDYRAKFTPATTASADEEDMF